MPKLYDWQVEGLLKTLAQSCAALEAVPAQIRYQHNLSATIGALTYERDLMFRLLAQDVEVELPAKLPEPEHA